MTTALKSLAGWRAVGAYALALLFSPSVALEAQLLEFDADRVLRARQTMVVSEHPLASQIGLDVLDAGGNAVDAAVAVGFALAVTHPAAGNVGGGGFMLIRFPDGRTTAIDFREAAPAASYADMFVVGGEYSSEAHRASGLAVGVPGTVAGFDKAHRLYGSMNWERLVYPSVALAEDGFTLSAPLAGSLARLVDNNRTRPSTVQTFSREGQPYIAGDLWRQFELGRTLTNVMVGRSNGFYGGETARLLVEQVRVSGGSLTEADLAAYQAKERTPLVGHYRGYEVITMPPPSSGGVALIEMLNVLQGFDVVGLGHNSSRYVHHLAEVMRRAHLDGARYLADPDQVDVPVQRPTDGLYARDLRVTIDPRRASRSSPADVASAGPLRESPETTHFSVVDRDGMAVSVTYSLSESFGVGIAVAGGGFLLNSAMSDFNGRRGLTTSAGMIGSEPNTARPGQRVLSSMSPTILTTGGRLVAVLGSTGGRAIANTILQIVLSVVDFSMTPEQAMAAGRIHHQWLPDRIMVEDGGLTPQTVGALQGMGHTVSLQGPQGLAHAIFIDAFTGERVGLPDPRSPGARAVGR